MTAAELLLAQRQAQLDREAAVALELIRLYGPVTVTTMKLVRQALTDAAAARAAGVIVSHVWFEQWAAANRLDSRVAEIVERFAQQAEPVITEATRTSAIAGATDGHKLLVALELVPRGIPIEATAEIAAALRVGAPLRALIDELPRAASARIRDALATAILAGRSPIETAADMTPALGGNAARALRIARTEQLSAYRRAALVRYRENRDSVDGWIWVAKLDTSTCAACVAMHGTVHPLTEEMASHPNCRCSPAPHTTSVATRLRLEAGVDWFDRQPDRVQRTILGPGKLAAYRRGDFDFEQLATHTHDPVWGPGLRETPLYQLV